MNSITSFELSNQDINDVSGGFICAGLCIAGAVVGGVIFGSGLAIGYNSK